MNEILKKYSDRDIINDLLATQHNIINAYNSSVCECQDTALRHEMLDLLFKEHALYSDLQKEIEMRQWSQNIDASKGLINNIKETVSATPKK